MYLKISEPISLTGAAGGPPPKKPLSARRALKRKRKGRFQVFRSAYSGTPSFARFGGKFFI